MIVIVYSLGLHIVEKKHKLYKYLQYDVHA